MQKYITVKISGIITSIAKTTDIEGYSEDILQTVIPDDLSDWKTKYKKEWIDNNNSRMEAICDFLNGDFGNQH